MFGATIGRAELGYDPEGGLTNLSKYRCRGNEYASARLCHAALKCVLFIASPSTAERGS